MRGVLKSFKKDPHAVLDYDIDWNEDGFLGATDTIASETWTVPTGITKDSNSHTNTVTTVWLSGGTHGTDYDLACKIVTTEGRTDERTICIQVRNR